MKYPLLWKNAVRNREYDFCTILTAIFESKKKRNRAYTLRSFARDLEFSPSMLSQLLTRKKQPSPALVEQISQKLDLSTLEAHLLRLFDEYSRLSLEELRQPIGTQIEAVYFKNLETVLSGEKFSVLSNWRHLAVADALRLGLEGRSSEEQACKALKIDSLEFRNSIEILLSHGLVKRNVDGTFSETLSQPVFDSKTISEDFQRYFLSIVGKSTEHLQKNAPDTEYVSTLSLRLSMADLKEAKVFVDEFVTKLRALSERSKNPEGVYCFFSHLFPLVGEE